MIVPLASTAVHEGTTMPDTRDWPGDSAMLFRQSPKKGAGASQRTAYDTCCANTEKLQTKDLSL